MPIVQLISEAKMNALQKIIPEPTRQICLKYWPDSTRPDPWMDPTRVQLLSGEGVHICQRYRKHFLRDRDRLTEFTLDLLSG